jgi:hypothetical protein
VGGKFIVIAAPGGGAFPTTGQNPFWLPSKDVPNAVTQCDAPSLFPAGFFLIKKLKIPKKSKKIIKI